MTDDQRRRIRGYTAFRREVWGPENPGGDGEGTRVFDVFCNGVVLLRDLDVYKEAGGDRPLVKTFHRHRANAQGKLKLSFVPVKNYASVYAVEVIDESPQRTSKLILGRGDAFGPQIHLG